MKKLCAAIVATVIAFIWTAATIALFVSVSIRISLIANPVLHGALMLLELIGGIFWLLAVLYVSTRVVLYFSPDDVGDG